ncbi:zinc ribbon domain-containing protein [Clostridium minihomine]|uniref:zinc ribbon domain-containing protein n=1 Tax=Clostridium minihomine TaxID=2045012 RepID=UPI001FB34ABC|nr:zinc ribbon domain-containing protein [Clostridium minihomine]
MICSNCGTEIQSGKFCSECGAPVIQAEPQLPNQFRAVDTSTKLGAEKYYKKDEKIVNLALSREAVTDSEDIVLHAGKYFSNVDNYFIFVCVNELVFCKLNEKKPENDIVARFSYTDSRIADFYNPKNYKFNISEEDVGFNPKKVIAYIPTLQVVYDEVQRLCGKDYAFPVTELKQPEKSFWQKISEESRELNRQREMTPPPIKPKQLSKKERIKENKTNGIACCPKCASTSLSANKKGFGIGKAVVGAGAGIFTAGAAGLIGLTAGNAGAKKVIITCLNCGHQWKP